MHLQIKITTYMVGRKNLVKDNTSSANLKNKKYNAFKFNPKYALLAKNSNFLKIVLWG